MYLDQTVANIKLAMYLPFFISIILKSLLLTAYAVSEETLDSYHGLLAKSVPNKITGNGSSFASTLTTPTRSHDHHFDFLMFVQLWPITSCIEWEERAHDHTCTLNGKLV